MSYQVLARKWRPAKFSELVGQEHVVSAVSNGLSQGRLHHAYLFAGTRGVGKTTIARIFAKSLNCEQGMSAEPCGVCDTCRDIDAGRYVDLLEIDAASRTKVEDTRDILDNVQYKPTRGQYKVYLIDEVHMLSKHSFNALLKTLEEPPPHVKFLFATTDPQKLPITILSRCLQFNLKALSKEQIQQQLSYILEQERIGYDTPALAQLARAARGSMRDALSLTDQAIAQGNGVVNGEQVIQMLGLMDANLLMPMIVSLLAGDKEKTFEQFTLIAQKSPDYESLIAEMLSILHQVALTQFVPEVCKVESSVARVVYKLAMEIPPEQLQLMYQIAIQGRKDLPYASEPRSGFEMTLLRMLSFNPTVTLASSDELKAGIIASQQMLQKHNQAALNAPGIESLAGTNTVPEERSAIATDTPIRTANESLTDPVLPVTNSHRETEASHSNSEQADTSIATEKTLQTAERDLSHDAMMQEQLMHQQNMVEMQAESMMVEQPAQYTDGNAAVLDDSSSTDALASLLDLHDELTIPEPQQVEKKNDNPQSFENTEKAVDSFQFTRESISSERPPWLDATSTPPIPTGATTDRSQPTVEIEQPPSPQFDATQPIAADVTMSVPVFNEQGEKIVTAGQIDNWSQLVQSLGLIGLVKQLALCADFQKDDNRISLTVLQDKEDLCTPSAISTIQHAFEQYFGHNIYLDVVIGNASNTPVAIQQEIGVNRQKHAESVIATDPVLEQLNNTFGATVVDGSVKPR